jgi:Domain of unknown function (DUF4173)
MTSKTASGSGLKPLDFSFFFKVAGALALAWAADGLFFLQRAGTTLGAYALLILMLFAAVRPAAFRAWPARTALVVAFLFALLLAADPSFLALWLYWTALTMAALLPRTARFDDGWRWAHRLALHACIAPFVLVRDRIILNKAKARRGPGRIVRRALVLILPAIGSLVFIALFAAANPLIGDLLARIDLVPDFGGELVGRLIFWSIVLGALWSVLRPPRVRLAPEAPGGDPELALPGVSVPSVALSLAAFNAIFALQNGLDLAFLWSGAALPDHVTLAEYAHRGAYPLIATALLAGLFVLITLRPGSATARSSAIRLMVTLWIAQNLLLVASTMLRTFDYIEAYSLTRLRIAALIWMGLVAIGLALICYRLLRGKSGAWLINANMLAALLALGFCASVDLGRMAAAWNIRHAREAGGRGTALDLCYLNSLGSSALLPLVEMEARPRLPDELRMRLAWLRTRTLTALAASQADWHGWTLRGADRLATARMLVAEHRLPAFQDDTPRDCDGRLYPPDPPAPTPVVAETSEEAAPMPPPGPDRDADGTQGEAPAKPLTAPAGR